MATTETGLDLDREAFHAARAELRRDAAAHVKAVRGDREATLALAHRALDRLSEHDRAGIAHFLLGYDPEALLTALVSMNPEAVQR